MLSQKFSGDPYEEQDLPEARGFYRKIESVLEKRYKAQQIDQSGDKGDLIKIMHLGDDGADDMVEGKCISFYIKKRCALAEHRPGKNKKVNFPEQF